MINSELIDQYLKIYVKLKRRNYRFIYFPENQAVERIQYNRLKYHLFLKINEFMHRLILYSQQLQQGKVDAISGFPLAIKLEPSGDKFFLRMDRDDIQFLKDGMVFFPYDIGGFEFSPLSKLFNASDCAVGLLRLLNSFQSNRISNLTPVKVALNDVMSLIKEHIPKYESSINSLDRLVRLNCNQLLRYTNGLVRHHKELIAIQMKLLVLCKGCCRVSEIEEVKTKLPVLLRGRAHRGLNSKISGFIWKVEMVEKAVCVHLVLFIKPGNAVDPELFRLQVCECWVKLVSTVGQGGYSFSWRDGTNKIESYPFLNMQLGTKDWIVSMQEMVYYIALQDLLVRYVGKMQYNTEQFDVEGADKVDTTKVPKKASRSWGKGSLPKAGVNKSSSKAITKKSHSV